jgi:hypothetical protein
MDTLLAKVKVALRIVTEDFDGELTDLINAALLDMNLAGVSETELKDALIIRAVITYCKMNFGEPDQYDRLKKSYDEQKAQLGMATGYTTWSY